MSSPFQNSIFHFLLDKKNTNSTPPLAILGGLCGSRFDAAQLLAQLPIVIFDFETTGLDTRTARIIEIGAIKYSQRKEVERFSQLVNPGISVSKEITKITGIDNNMLADQPSIQEVLPKFHEFLLGCVGFAHNAEFDVGMLFHESTRIGISCDYTIFCSLKMARALVKVEKRNLDALAKHYNLQFESRHRSIGDILVTAEVVWRMLDENQMLQNISHMSAYRVSMPEA